MKNSDYIIQEREPEFDRDLLHRKSFAVNMRLFYTSKFYRKHIEDIFDYMAWSMEQKWEDYQSNPAGGTYGISGANLGIPYNIIAYKNKGTLRFMINPKIIEFSDKMVETKSNCGSIKYKEKITVKRYAVVMVEYFNMYGVRIVEEFTAKNGGFTIQHEIDHSNGILITDRFIEQGGDPKTLENL